MVKKNDTNSKPVVPTAAAPSTPVAAAKRAVKPAAKAKKTVAKAPKAPASVKAKRTTKPKAPTTPVASVAPAYTREDVALRAYFISEKRRNHGLHGDEHQDWVEAERQLMAESAQPVKKAKKA